MQDEGLEQEWNCICEICEDERQGDAGAILLLRGPDQTSDAALKGQQRGKIESVRSATSGGAKWPKVACMAPTPQSQTGLSPTARLR